MSCSYQNRGREAIFYRLKLVFVGYGVNNSCLGTPLFISSSSGELEGEFIK